MQKIEIKKVSHSFFSEGEKLSVIENITFDLDKGDIVSILGPSGCGKSTLLKCIAGLIEPLKGSIRINNLKPKEALKQKKIGFAFQESALIEWRNVQENILLPFEIGKKKIQRDPEKIAADLLKKTDLENFKKYFPYQLSGGMKQRVVLARTLMSEPKLLLLDEPFGSLDLLTRTLLIVEISNLLHSIGTPTLLVTHNIEEAVFLSKKIYILSSLPGKIVDKITIDFPWPRNQTLFDNKRFTEIVSYSRNKLFKNWKKNGK